MARDQERDRDLAPIGALIGHPARAAMLAAQRADRRYRLALGLGFATTGALLNHGRRVALKVPRS